MQHVRNISITGRAASFLSLQRRRIRLGTDDLPVMGFVSRFVNGDGSAVAGYTPGYMLQALQVRYVSDRSLVAHLPDGTVFYFLPRFTWKPGERYLVDLDGFMFTIGPAG